jgi:hypothetical protein
MLQAIVCHDNHVCSGMKGESFGAETKATLARRSRDQGRFELGPPSFVKFRIFNETTNNSSISINAYKTYIASAPSWTWRKGFRGTVSAHANPTELTHREKRDSPQHATMAGELSKDAPRGSSATLNWYDNTRPMFIDLVGDYAGKELFLVEGDSLLRMCFDDERIDFQGKPPTRTWPFTFLLVRFVAHQSRVASQPMLSEAALVYLRTWVLSASRWNGYLEIWSRLSECLGIISRQNIC